MPATAAANEKALQKLWDLIATLSATSSDADFEAIGALFADNTTAYMNGMSAPPAKGRAGVVAGFRQLVQFWAIAESRVTGVFSAPDGRTVVREMANRLLIVGESVDDYKEAEVVEFDEQGLISQYRLYCDSSPIMAILVKKGIMPAPKFD
jgi:ketosteroid isomerase-like protein